jgi:predicted RNase H-like nuclease (RuvC/YqgF family)
VKDRRFDRFLDRFDAHIARFDAHIERMDAHIERMDVHMAETRTVIRESSIHQERALQAFEARLELLQQEFHESREERRAHTQAIWALLDRWGYGPPPDPA